MQLLNDNGLHEDPLEISPENMFDAAPYFNIINIDEDEDICRHQLIFN